MSKHKNKKSNTRNSNGEGTIYYHESKNAYIASLQVNGKRTARQSKTYEGAKEKLENLKKSLSTESSDIDVSNITLENYIEDYLILYKLNSIKPASYDTLDNVFRNHIKNSKLGSLKLKDVKTKDIQELINKKSKILSLSRLKKILEVLNGAFKKAIANEYIERNPVNGVELPSKENQKEIKKITCYSDDEVNKILKVCYLNGTNSKLLYRHGPAFDFILNTGIREGEACAMKWSDITTIDNQQYITIGRNVTFSKERDSNGNSLGRKLKIITPKTSNSYRDIPLNKSAINSLNAIKENNKVMNIDSEYILCRHDGNLLNPRNLITTFIAITKKANVKHNGIHALRHTFATNCLRCGIDIGIVSKLLGHADVQITYKHYIHVVKELKINAINVLDDLHKPKK